MSQLISSFHQLSALSLDGPRVLKSQLAKGKIKLYSSLISLKTVSSGVEQYAFDNVSVALCSKQALLTPSFTNIDVDISQTATGTCFYFAENALQERLNEAMSRDFEGSGREVNIPYGIKLPISNITSNLASKSTENSGLEDLQCDVAEYLATLSFVSNRLDIRRPSAKTELASRLSIAYAYIFDNLDTNITLHDLSRACCLSRFYLSHSFKRAFGKPPLRFHQHQRLLRSKQKVIDGQDLNALAVELGFADITSFSRAYARVHGVRPSLHKKAK